MVDALSEAGVGLICQPGALNCSCNLAGESGSQVDVRRAQSTRTGQADQEFAQGLLPPDNGYGGESRGVSLGDDVGVGGRRMGIEPPVVGHRRQALDGPS